MTQINNGNYFNVDYSQTGQHLLGFWTGCSHNGWAHSTCTHVICSFWNNSNINCIEWTIYNYLLKLLTYIVYVYREKINKIYNVETPVK